MKAADRENF